VPAKAAIGLPIVDFSANVTQGTAPFDVLFSDNSSSATGWAWFFGDETYAEPWVEMNASSGWSPRMYHTAAAVPDGHIVLTGGWRDTQKTDTWVSADKGATWTLMNESAECSGRTGLSSAGMRDNSVILTGGDDDYYFMNDVWRSVNYGATWTLVNGSAGWSARESHSTVVLPDESNSIVLTGGWDGDTTNDTWRSMDGGATWTLMNVSSGWKARFSHCTVALADNSIVLMGGNTGHGKLQNDTWRSTDGGASWVLVNVSSGWEARARHTCVVMPDDSIVLMGGKISGSYANDAWRSMDGGATWMCINTSAVFWYRDGQTSVALPDGSIVLTGGDYWLNDTWRFMPAGSSAQNPSHAYTLPGTYQVSLQVTNALGFNSTRRTGYITVTPPAAPVANFTGTPTLGIVPLNVSFTDLSTNGPTAWNWSFGDGTFSSGRNPNHMYTASGTYTVSLNASNAGGCDIKTENGYVNVTNAPGRIGVVRNNNTWLLDASGNGTYGAGDLSYVFGKAGDVYVTGDWNTDGKTKIGVVRNSNTWLLDASGNGAYGAGDLTYVFGKAGDVFVTGDWNTDGKTEIGVVRNNNTWLLDASGNGAYGAGDLTYVFGKAGDVFVTGDWNTDGKTEIGVVRNNNTWLLDASGNGAYGAGDLTYVFGKAGDVFVTGDWNTDGKTEIGVVRNNNTWLLDASGNGAYGAGDLSYVFGKTSDTYVTGKWV